MKVPVKFPEGVELLIHSGEIVDFSTPFYRKKAKKKVRVPLAETLGFKPDKIFLNLKKVIGDKIKKGDLLAENKSFLSTRQYFSSVDGVIEEIDHLNGIISIELESDQDHVVSCFFTGELETVGEEYLEIKVKKTHKVDIVFTDYYIGAPIFYILDPEKTLTEENISERFICGKAINPLDLAKMETFETKGFITNSQTGRFNNLKQIILKNEEDFDHILKEQYPYCILGVDLRSIYFYK